jgi:hypothetical protein
LAEHSQIAKFANLSAEMAGGCEGANRRIDTTDWRLARLLPPSAADARERAAADIWGVAAKIAIKRLNAKAQGKEKYN